MPRSQGWLAEADTAAKRRRLGRSARRRIPRPHTLPARARRRRDSVAIPPQFRGI